MGYRNIDATAKVADNEKVKKARQFCMEVKELALKYNLPFFVVTDGNQGNR